MPKLNSKGNGKTTKGWDPKWATPSRKVVYKEYSEERCVGATALTYARAKELLGWEETEKDDYLFKDMYGRKVKCTNNVLNRPFVESHADALAQKFLNKHWKYNGEGIIIGCTARVISGQHRLIGFCLAEQRREGPQTAHWEEIHSGPLTMETLVIYGIHEDQETINSVDNVRTRTLKDVLFTNKELFGGMTSKARLQIFGMADHATKMLWARTGMNKNAFNGIRTHDEAANFINNHPRLKDALKCVHEEYEKNYTNAVGYMSPGYAAALLYMMGMADSDGISYRNLIRQGAATEKGLDDSMWKKAVAFWTDLAAGKMNGLREALHSYLGINATGRGASRDERVALIIKSWNLYRKGKKVTMDAIELEYSKDKEGIPGPLKYIPCIGGIDMEVAAEPEKQEEAEDGLLQASVADTGDGEDKEDTEEYDLEEEVEEDEVEGVAGMEVEKDDGWVPTPEELEKSKEAARLRRERAEAVSEHLKKLKK